MNNTNKPTDAAALAGQLACPSGTDGIKTGVQMQTVNRNMIRETIDRISLKEADTILEIGPGNASHIDLLLQRAKGIRYFGADTSATMIAEAQKHAAEQVVSFHLTDGLSLPFDNIFFNSIFSINTLYFWKDPIGYAREVHRVLKPEGRFHLTFAEKSSIHHLPFTSYGFRLYDTEEAVQLLTKAGFKIRNVDTCSEEIVSNGGDLLQRQFTIITASAK